MRCFLLFSVSSSILLLAGCEEGEGTQIGNEGVVVTDPSENGCAARTLSADSTFEGWPSTLGGATTALISNLRDVELDVDGTITGGSLSPVVQGYRLVEGDCDNVYVEVELAASFSDGVLQARTTGDLRIAIDRPTAGAVGELSATQWSGSLLPAPSSQRTLYLDVVVRSDDMGIDVVLETCVEPESCTEETYGVIEPV